MFLAGLRVACVTFVSCWGTESNPRLHLERLSVMTKMLASAMLVLLALILVGCDLVDSGGHGDAPPRERERIRVLAPGDPKPELACTGGTNTGFFDFGADATGAKTPRAAVSRYAEGGKSVVLSATGKQAWVIRPDGTPSVQLKVVQLDDGRGWHVGQSNGCSR